MKILLLEDDYALGETLQELLVSHGYTTVWARDGESAASEAYEARYDLYVFDINVPEIDGFELLEGLRDASDQTPVIFISALTDLSSITKGFKLGAQDYLKKPFFPEELIFRIKARLQSQSSEIVHEGIAYRPQTRDVFKNGKPLSMGEVQLPLLELFITNIGRTLTKESLLDILEHPSDTALRVAINKLKQTTQWEILNLRGIGYRLEAR